ncbi:Lysophospholipase [Cocos nucifera]|uniref:Lysophospholipase n=1 Tax=Cocos nucifera TaxID=13894 RepID=A0A8K0HVJ8_COCNU|nr:Lysophospholipase [Cocos nucifera]
MSLLRSNYPVFLKPLALVAITLAATSLFTSFVQHRTPRPLPDRPMATVARSFVLWLHGLGDSGPANEPIRTFFSSPEFKHTKWSFPSAPHAPVSCNSKDDSFFDVRAVRFVSFLSPRVIELDGAVMSSWFDIYEIPVSAESPKDEKGLLGAVQKVHAMIDKEVAAGISPENIFICGFSQGGALTLASVLLYPKTLGGGAVFSGWVPFNSSIIEHISPEARKTPILWSHGMADKTVLFGAGQAGPPFLERAGMSCEFKCLVCVLDLPTPAIITKESAKPTSMQVCTLIHCMNLPSMHSCWAFMEYLYWL